MRKGALRGVRQGAAREAFGKACRRTYQFQLRAKALESGTYIAYNCNRFVRQYLISKIGERCSRCGRNERHPKTGRAMIEVEQAASTEGASGRNLWEGARTRFVRYPREGKRSNRSK